MGKSLGSDLAKGKKTFLLINAFSLANDEQSKELRSILKRGEITGVDMGRVREIFEECGVFELAAKNIEMSIREAESALDFIPHEKRKNLLMITDLVRGRKN